MPCGSDAAASRIRERLKARVEQLTKVRKTFFIPSPVVDAYREWKSYWGLSPAEEDGESCVIKEKPNRELHWSARWGITRIEGEAEFIPAQGGCVLYLGLDGAGPLSRLLLATPFPLSRHLWRSVERFQLPQAEAGGG